MFEIAPLGFFNTKFKMFLEVTVSLHSFSGIIILFRPLLSSNCIVLLFL